MMGETKARKQAAQDLAKKVARGDIERDELEKKKKEICSQYGAELPKNSEILKEIPEENREKAKEILRTKPVRTKSGVTPVAVMTSPAPCPHGKCTFCPGGPDSEFDSPQAYTGKEPAGRRGEYNDYDPYDQVEHRLSDLHRNGHPIDKIELILMGGTLTARPIDYQEWFVKRCLEAMNDFQRQQGKGNWSSFEQVENENENSNARNVTTTFETKPDWCGKEQIDLMLRLGGTKVEVGVETTHDPTLKKTHRGHTDQDTRKANRKLRDAGFKVGFHMMPGLPGRTPEDDLEDFKKIFQNTAYRPDYLKIYPTLVVKDTGIYHQWKNGDYNPLTTEEAKKLVAKIKSFVPEYTRISRVQRDIPATEIEAGVQKSNLRQLAKKHLKQNGGRCDCIRCREVGMNDQKPTDIETKEKTYRCAGGREFFIQKIDPTNNLLLGFIRLRFPGSPTRKELKNSGIVRELHVYGTEAGIDEKTQEKIQHRGIGTELMEKAENKTKNQGYEKLTVLSGIGVRNYYRDIGYTKDGSYMSKKL